MIMAQRIMGAKEAQALFAEAAREQGSAATCRNRRRIS